MGQKLTAIYESLDEEEDGLEKGIIRADDFAKIEFPPRKPILFPFLLESTIGMIAALSGLGKTILGLHIAKAVATEGTLGNFRGNGSPVLYVDGEMDERELQTRVKSIFRDTIPLNLFLYSDHLATQRGLPKARLDNTEWQAGIQDFCREYGVKLLVLDNLSCLLPGKKENEKEEWDPVAQFLISLRFEGIATLFFHHTGKKEVYRGSSGIIDALDYSILLKKPNSYRVGEAHFVLHFDKIRILVEDKELVQDTEFRFHPDEPILVSKPKGRKDSEVLRLLGEGLSQKDIGKKLEINESGVSKAVKRLIAAEYLTPGKEPTELGKKLIEDLNGNF